MRSQRKERKMNRYNREKIWKRCLAVIVLAVTLLGGLNYPGLESVLANEKSGYTIDVSYSEESNQVTLTGNTENVAAGITLTTLADPNGQEYAPDVFQTTITENGTYTYVLTYSETIAESGEQAEKTETLTVRVDQIKTLAEESEKTLPRSVLEASLKAMSVEERATASDSIDVYQYAAELNTKDINNNSPVSFGGGAFSVATAPEWSGGTGGITREFASAGYVLTDESGTSPHLITGLYPYLNDNNQYDWYYILADSTGSTGEEYGDIEVGHLLPDGATIRLYYRLSSDRYTLTLSNQFDQLGFGYSLSGMATGTVQSGGEVMAGDSVTVSVQLASSYMAAVITLEGVAGNPTYRLIRPTVTTGNPEANHDAVLTDDVNYWYDVTFEMPENAVNVGVVTTPWSEDTTRTFAVYLPEGEGGGHESNATQAAEFGFTRLFTTHVSRSIGGTKIWADQLTYSGQYSDFETYNYYGLGRYQTDSVGGYWVNNNGTISTGSGNNAGAGSTGSTGIDSNTSTGGGAPYTQSEWYGWPGFGSAPTEGVTVKQSGDPTKTGKWIELANVYTEMDGSSRTQVAAGHFYPGGSVGLRLETGKASKYIYATSNHYKYTPGSLYIDVYEGSETISSENFTRYILPLMDLQGLASGNNTTKSRTISIGEGTATVYCIRSGVTNYDPYNPTSGTSYAANDYGGQWSGGVSFNSYKSDTNLNRTAQADVYAFYIEINGLTRPFKVSYKQVSGTQQNNFISSVDGIESGIRTGGAISGSVLETNQGNIPLQAGYFFIRSTNLNSTNGYQWVLALVPQEGYGGIDVKWTDSPGGNPLSNSSVAYEGVGASGRYRYRVTHNIGNYTSAYLSVSASPLNFTTQYRYNGSSYTHTSSGTILSYESTGNKQRSLTVPADAIPPTAQGFMQGFSVEVYAGNNKILTLSPPGDGSQTYWQSGDRIRVEDVYAALRDGGHLNNSTVDYTLVLNAQMSSASEADYVDAQFTVYNQTTYFDGDGLTNDKYTNSNFSNSSSNIRVERGAQVLFTGFKEQYQTTAGGKKYILDDKRSSMTGIATSSGENIADIYYLSAATVKIEIPTDVDSILAPNDKTAITNWNANNGSTYYTGSSSAGQSTVTLPALGGTTTDNSKVFSGWRIVRTGTNTATGSYGLYSYVISGNSLDLNAMGNSTGDGLSAWNAAFGTSGSGTITLIPYYADNMKPIQVPAGGESQTVKFYRDQSFSVQFVMEGEVTEANALAQYAVYRSQPEDQTQEDPEPFRAVAVGTVNLYEETATINNSNAYYPVLENPVSVAISPANGQTTITLTLSNVTEGGTDRTYRVYLWNRANGDLEAPIGSLSAAQWNNSIPAELSGGNYKYVDRQVFRVPQVYNQTEDSTVTVHENLLFYEEQPFTVTGTLRLEGANSNSNGGNKETIQALLTEPTFAGDLKIALYKRNPTSTGTQLYQPFGMITTSDADSNQDGYLDLVFTNLKNTIDQSSVTIRAEGSSYKTFTVSFAKSGNVSHTNDDGAQYIICAWTNTNSIDNLPNDFGGTTNLPAETNFDTIGIPSVTTTTTGVLGTQAENMIKFPSAVTMSDDGDQHIYSGNEQITLEAIAADAELPDPDSGVDVTIEQLTNSKTFNISRSNNDTIELQAFTGTRTSGGTDISASGGKVGTMKFSTGAQPMQNTLPLYFKSKDTVTGFADGDPFIGHITFRFSKAASN